ncbi:MAG: urea transport system permease protein [Actinomycetota bacterium]|jgi:urea transport system permease protein|nr:urea transport system permease protein [Actinomycetota bacterium]
MKMPGAGGGSRNPWYGRIGFALVALGFLVLAPATLSDFGLNLFTKYLCYAIIAVGIGLAWGQGGMLSLGQGVFFGLGGYAMGMYLKLQAAGPGKVPDFMSWSGVEKLPLLWKPFQYAWIALPAVVVVPMAVAAGLGAMVFRRRVRGAYFAILTQALAAAFVILLIGEQGYTGGTNGLTNFSQAFGLDLADPTNQRMFYFITAGVLGAMFLLARQLMASRYGRLLVAVRDGEERVRFLGYNPTVIKVIAFSISAGMAGLAGALFVPVVGIISPALLGIVPSIEMVILVALGGRSSLVGPVIGALAVNYAKTSLSNRFPSGWLYLEGLLFVVVIGFAPMGLAGLAGYARSALDRLRGSPGASPADEAKRLEDEVVPA